MRIQHFLIVFLFLNLTIALNSCKNSPQLTFRVSSFDTTITPKKISISELVKNYKSFQGQYIETTGRFQWAFEEFAIYANKSFLTGEAEGFWLSTVGLNIDLKSLDKMNGEEVTIRGRIDTTHTGHLNQYLATIDKIYFWQH